jgi:hypothetical protein
MDDVSHSYHSYHSSLSIDSSDMVSACFLLFLATIKTLILSGSLVYVRSAH